jgi:hypothetical protein
LRLHRGTGSRYVRSVSASQHSVNEHPYPACFQPIVTDSSPGVYSAGCRPRRLEKCAFHDAPIASADPARSVEACSTPARHFWPTCVRDRASDAPVANPIRYRRCAFSRCAHFRFGWNPPRPLPPRRRDATKLFPVQDAFPRQEMRCSSSGLSTGDCASVPGLEAPRCFWHRETRVVPRPLRVVLRTPRRGFSTLRRLRLLSARVASHRKTSYEERATRDATSTCDFTSEGQAPVHRVPQSPFRSVCVWGKGFFGPSRLSTSATRQQRTGTIHEAAPRPLRNHVPLARPMIP